MEIRLIRCQVRPVAEIGRQPLTRFFRLGRNRRIFFQVFHKSIFPIRAATRMALVAPPGNLG